MSVLDGLTEEQRRQASDDAMAARTRVVAAVASGRASRGGDFELTADEALAIARFHAMRMERIGDPEATSADPLEMPCQVRSVDGFGRIFRGDGTPVDDTLAGVQAALIAKIDAKAEDRIVNGQGFEHPPGSGERFSLSLQAQTKWSGLYNARNSVTYPYVVPTKDDQQYHSVVDAAEVEAMYQAAVSTLTTELDAANAAKQNLLAAATTAEARTAADAYLELTADPVELIAEP